MDLIKDKADCCGCRTCELICPECAITMKEDECGFLYPEINAKKCKDCGLCVKKCAFQSGYKKRKEFKPFYGYAARHNDYDVLMRSRSGGAFTAISDVILENGGVVFGVGYYKEKSFFEILHKDGKCFYKVIHKMAKTKEERNEFCGSKYVQSDLGNVFEQVKKVLEEGTQVLFTGTGCQVGALHKYLGKEYDNLITMDIVCHGVQPMKLWRDFLDMREREQNGKVTDVNFRNKEKFGWNSHKETVWVEGKEISSRLFSKIYSIKVAIRPSCFKCKYTNKNRPGDLTIADFWGHEKAVPGFYDDDKGISLVMVSTKKGKDVWDKATESMDIVDCTGYNFRHLNMKRPTPKPDNCEEFWEDYREKGFDFIMEKYCNYNVVTYEQVIQEEINKEIKREELEKKRKKKQKKKKIKRYKQKVKKKIINIKQRVKNKIKKVIGYE